MKEREMQEKPLNEKESLELITRMIQNTQQKLERRAGAPMLIWGYATVIASIFVLVVLTLTSDYRCNYFWFMIPVIGVTCMLLRKKQPKGVYTYIDKVVGYIWLVLGVTGSILSVISIFSFMGNFPILFIIIIIMGIGSVLTGLVTEFKPMIVGGVIGLVISISHQLVPTYNMKIITFILAFVAMYIIPGHILNYRVKKACLKN